MTALVTTVFLGVLAAAALTAGTAFAQAPAAPPAETQRAPSPPPTAPADPAPPAPAAPAAPPAVAAPDAPASVLPSDEVVQGAGFGDEVTLEARPAVILPGKTTWDDLYGTFRKAIEQLTRIASANGLTASGPPMIRFVSSSDDQVDYEAILPVTRIDGDPARLTPAKPGETPAGRAIRFVHHGGYDTMEQTYDEITNHLDERGIAAEDAFVEEYVRDPDKTPETEMATFIYVFPKK
ncbi:MAG: GyrI-like domain-containing protein [Phreatobacter sp.]|uniref:GyrI-like domain-containing protein n=1 Tax=Phreatobacter sp. TaxID=1966341 RepID=UPI001A3B3C33|nr:GyrI-like domain-containing protein [Phreatobacter sp.]MBL8568134.1 GyrI-like domain-containing protein [Phreatobacter sp.]